MSYSELWVFTDGGARGNPGPAAIGVYVCDGNGKEVAKHSHFIGKGTNNIAEYSALLEGISMIKRFNSKNITFKLDSELVVKQLKGEYKVKEPALRKLYFDVKSSLDELSGAYQFAHIRREQNKIADELVNDALDKEALS